MAWLSPRDPGYRIHGLALDLGGPGGRRFEAVVISAGPQGFAASNAVSGTTPFRLFGR